LNQFSYFKNTLELKNKGLGGKHKYYKLFLEGDHIGQVVLVPGKKGVMGADRGKITGQYK